MRCLVFNLVSLFAWSTIPLLLMRIAKDAALPFAFKAQNAETRDAITELHAGRGERFEWRNRDRVPR